MHSWMNAGWRRAERKTGIIARTGLALCRLFGRFSADASGQIAVIFGLSGVVLVIAIGAGVDLTSAYAARQQLSHIATLTCQYSNRPTVLATQYTGSSGQATYTQTVNNYYANSVSQQNFKLSQTGAGFNYVPGGNSTFAAAATMNTNFMQMIGVPSLSLSVTVQCGSSPTSQPPTSGGLVVSEGFENSYCTGSGYCWAAYNPNGQRQSFIATPVNSPTGVVGYVGTSGTQWQIMGYCIEIDGAGIIKSTVPQGNFSAELDCDNGAGSAGNSSISTRAYLSVGTYELRYNYSSRIAYPNYDPAYLCGSQASDLSWANDTYNSGKLRTNQINVYLDQDSTGEPPVHTTIDGTQQLAGSNLIDMCVESTNWIERSVLINVTTAGNYWLSFAADGANDSYGGQIDNIRLCVTACAGSVQDNFPFTANQVLFEETFESPTVAQACGPGGCGNVNTTLNSFYGTTGTASSGWPSEAQRSWASAPYNQTDIEFQSPTQGSQYIQVEGNQTGGQTTSNHTVSRYFYLDPGYYKISYYYISDVLFSILASTYCASPPYSAATFASLSLLPTTNTAGTNRLSGGNGSWIPNTNELAVFMSNSQVVSYANGGGALNSTTNYTNPDGSVSTTPTVPPDSLNTSAYNSSQPNALIDFCVASPSWTLRTTTVEITKPGQYWLNFASMGSSDSLGAAIDDVKLTALGSLKAMTAPVGTVVIPTAAPVGGPAAGAGTAVYYTGFNITADRPAP